MDPHWYDIVPCARVWHFTSWRLGIGKNARMEVKHTSLYCWMRLPTVALLWLFMYIHDRNISFLSTRPMHTCQTEKTVHVKYACSLVWLQNDKPQISSTWSQSQIPKNILLIIWKVPVYNWNQIQIDIKVMPPLPLFLMSLGIVWYQNHVNTTR